MIIQRIEWTVTCDRCRATHTEPIGLFLYEHLFLEHMRDAHSWTDENSYEMCPACVQAVKEGEEC